MILVTLIVSAFVVGVVLWLRRAWRNRIKPWEGTP